MSITDVLIIGGGPAGLSAALTLVRQHHTVVLFDTRIPRALPSLRIHGVLGSDSKPPQDVLDQYRSELAAYKDFVGVDAEVVQVKKINAGFEATDRNRKIYQGKKVILANGVKDHFPDIEGYAEAWGKGM
jgi:thioredoxin reductase